MSGPSGRDLPDDLPHDEKLRELYRQLPADEPRAELDERILEAARTSTRARPAPSVLRRLYWVPVAAAAGLVVAVMRLMPQAPGPISTVALPRAEEETMSTKRAKVTRDDDAARRPADTLRGRASIGADSAPAVDGGAFKRAAPVPAAPPPAAPAVAAPGKKDAPAQELAAPAPQARASAPAPQAGASAAAPASEPELRQNADRRPMAKPSMESYGLREEPEQDRDSSALRSAQQPSDPWPFGLEAFLDADEACRRLRETLKRDCDYRDDVARLELTPPVRIDRGKLAGEPASSIALLRRNGRLIGVELRYGSATVKLGAPE